jgi:hypothetical protein
MRLIIILSLAFSFSALACPNLSGNYPVCRSTTEVRADATDMIVKQQIQRGITIYEITSTDGDTQERQTEIFRTDGRNYNESQVDDENGWTLQTITNARCAGDILKISQTVKINGEIFAELKLDVTKVGGQLIQDVSGHMMEQEVSDKVICE